MENHANLTDVLAAVELLDAGAIRERLRRLDSEERALRVLLRATIARERHVEVPNGEAVPCKN
jgi:hypothetical protein